MSRTRQIICACILLVAVVVVLYAPAYSIEPTALRAWSASTAMLMALCTLVTFALAAPTNSEAFIREAYRPRSPGVDLLRRTCVLLI